jgi:hypothetical protein
VFAALAEMPSFALHCIATEHRGKERSILDATIGNQEKGSHGGG